MCRFFDKLKKGLSVSEMLLGNSMSTKVEIERYLGYKNPLAASNNMPEVKCISGADVEDEGVIYKTPGEALSSSTTEEKKTSAFNCASEPCVEGTLDWCERGDSW